MDDLKRSAELDAAFRLMSAGNLDGAEARVKLVLSQAADDAQALAMLAQCKLMRGKPKEALEIARAAATSDPEDDLVRRVLTSALLQNEKYKEADQIARDLAAEDPDDAQTLLRLAVSRFGQKDYAGGRDLIDEAEERAGHNVGALLALAQIRKDQWNWDAAEALARRVLSLDPTAGEVFQILGECALARKVPVEAYDLALEALRLQPGDKDTLKLLARARARRSALLRPFLPGIDWIIDMDRSGLIVAPLLLLVLLSALVLAAIYDATRVFYWNVLPSFVTLPLLAAFAYGVTCYAVAVSARWRIRRDLRRIALPNF